MHYDTKNLVRYRVKILSSILLVREMYAQFQFSACPNFIYHGRLVINLISNFVFMDE